MHDHFSTYAGLIKSLKLIILESKKRVINDPPDYLFEANQNFFVKAYLVSLCTYLEAFLQDLANAHVESAKERIASAQVPHNLMRWSIQRDTRDRDLVFSDFSLPLARSDIENELSGNPGKTISLFKKIGINLSLSADFESVKPIIGTVVKKRNRIIHQNDNATDLTLDDISGYADQFLLYMRAIHDLVVVGR
jgi:hypothetical protein